MINYREYDGLGLAELVKRKDIKVEELMEIAIKAIEKQNPKVNAVIHKFYEEGRRVETANIPNGAFEGVPFLLKDLLVEYKGMPYSMGSKVFKNYISQGETELMRRYRAAGLVSLGKTNTPEFGLTGYTEPEAFGATKTPWDLTRSSGGSSGGSAAAVASGMVPIASGGDGGGSIRIPASCCGIFGLKPTRGRIPTAPHGHHWQGAAIQHVLTRSVRDSAAMLDAINGNAPGAPYFTAPPSSPYLDAVTTEPRSLRIAFTTQSPIGSEVNEHCKNAVKEAATLLESLGHKVEEAQPTYNGLEVSMSYVKMYMGEVAATLDKLGERLGRKLTRKDVETTTWTLGLLGRSYHAGEFIQAIEVWHKLGRVMGAFHQDYDIYLTPTLASLPPKIGALKSSAKEERLMKIVNQFGLGKLLRKSGVVEQVAYKNFTSMPFTQLANLTGQPAMSVPLYWTDDNLPVGVQFVAPFGDETTLFQLAGQLERAKPWFSRVPML